MKVFVLARNVREAISFIKKRRIKRACILTNEQQLRGLKEIKLYSIGNYSENRNNVNIRLMMGALNICIIHEEIVYDW